MNLRSATLALVLSHLVWCGSAAAQADEASVTPSDGPTQAGEAAEDGTDQEARALFQAGQVAFTEGRFANALEYFERSYELSGRPALLFNMGAAADRLRRDDEALEFFQRYLAELPSAPNRAEVEARVAVLQQAQVSSSIAPPPDEPLVVVAPTPTTPSDPGPGPWIVLGTGLAAVVTGAVLIGFAVGDVASVENAPDGTPWATVRDAYDRSEPMSIGGVVLVAVGAAASVGGLAWGLGSGGGDQATATLQLIPGGAMVRGTF